MTTDLARLRSLASKVDPDIWRSAMYGSNVSTEKVTHVAFMAVRDLFAALDPQTVLALLDAAEASERLTLAACEARDSIERALWVFGDDLAMESALSALRAALATPPPAGALPMTATQPADPLREAQAALDKVAIQLDRSWPNGKGPVTHMKIEVRAAQEAVRAASMSSPRVAWSPRAVIYAVHQAINAVPPMHVIDTEYVPQAKRRANAVVDRHAVIVAVRDALHAALTEKKP
jgi:hypothetical protein